MATCIKCNTALKADYKACPECRTLVGQAKCVHCNRELEQGFKFCPYCTKPIEKPVNTSTSEQSKDQRQREAYKKALSNSLWIPETEEELSLVRPKSLGKPTRLGTKSPTDKKVEARKFFDSAYQHAEKGNHEEAISDYTKAIELDPKYFFAYYNRGVAQDELGNHEEAIADYTKAIELDPKYADAYYNRGVAHRKLGNDKEADQDFENSARLERGEDPITEPDDSAKDNTNLEIVETDAQSVRESITHVVARLSKDDSPAPFFHAAEINQQAIINELKNIFRPGIIKKTITNMIEDGSLKNIAIKSGYNLRLGK